MARSNVIILIALASLGFVLAESPAPVSGIKEKPYMNVDNVHVPPQPVEPTVTPKPTTSTTPTTTTAPTTTPTTTTAPTTTSTTTTAPTTTPTTTTAPTTTSTTTSAPTTTPTSPPTTTSAPSTTPAPIPQPEKGKWAYVDSKNVSCVIIQVAVQFNISYMNDKGIMKNTIFDLPVSNSTKVVDGSCGNSTQFITLQWPSLSVNETVLNNNVTITFSKNATDNKFSLSKMDFVLIQDSNFPYSNSNTTLNLSYNGTMFSIPLQKSYRCAKNEVFVLAPYNGVANSTVSIKDMQVQAFATDKGSSFSYAEDCEYVDVPDIVPIAVGCALGALVLIVLITYLVGRRNRQARGYLSM